VGPGGLWYSGCRSTCNLLYLGWNIFIFLKRAETADARNRQETIFCLDVGRPAFFSDSFSVAFVFISDRKPLRARTKNDCSKGH
jgi:hypothetical protein